MNRARDEILARLESSRPPAIDRPIPMTPPAMPIDPMATLQDRISQAGASLQSATRADWPEQIAWPIDRSAIQHVYSTLGAVPNKGVGVSPATDHDLDRLDLCVLKGEFAVVENGAVWQRPTTPRERAAALLATHLLIIVEAGELVATLHQAYARIESGRDDFGWFLCGPSKTADIEQSLVLGAHGPRTMSLILLRD